MLDDVDTNMFANIDSNIISDASQNDPSVAFGTTSMLGYMPLQIVAPQAKGTIVQPGFPQIPYVGFEWTAMFDASSSLISPQNILPGASAGQHVMASSYTFNDASGIPRFGLGYQSQGSGNSAA